VGSTYLPYGHDNMPCRMGVSCGLSEGSILTANCRNGWGPGGSNPKATCPC